MSSKSEKVLVVDDSKENVSLLTYILKPHHYEIISAFDGAEALRKVKQEKPDIILLDAMLPKMDGFQVCEKIKKNKETHHIPIIMITALQELKDKVRSLEAGADDFISKPYENIELLTRLKSLLRIKNYHDQLQKKNKELEDKNRALIRLEELKDELMHLIVHDMKNPLFVIQGNLQMMTMGMDDDSVGLLKKYLDRIDRSAQNLLRMVLNIIDISKIELEKMDLELEMGDINEIIRKTSIQVSDYPEYEEKELSLNLATNLAYIKIDHSVMERVFDNLINFALSSVPTDGKVQIESFQKKEKILITIHDFGPQLPMEYGEQIFDKFTQLEVKNEGYRIGRGFALTFCKLAVDAHGGSLLMDQNNKIGNKFILTFPA
jgi:K+-sensing histidine kinase KdpD